MGVGSGGSEFGQYSMESALIGGFDATNFMIQLVFACIYSSSRVIFLMPRPPCINSSRLSTRASNSTEGPILYCNLCGTDRSVSPRTFHPPSLRIRTNWWQVIQQPSRYQMCNTAVLEKPYDDEATEWRGEKRIVCRVGRSTSKAAVIHQADVS